MVDTSVLVMEEEDMAAITLHIVVVIMKTPQVLRRIMVWVNKKKREAQIHMISLPREVKISAIGVV